MSLRSRAKLGAILGLLCASLAAQASEPILRFWMVGAGLEDTELYNRIGREFEKTEHVKVEFTPLPWGSFKTKYLVSMAAGLPPDVGITNNGGAFDYGVVGGIVDLKKEFPAQINELLSRYQPKTLPLESIGDHLYGVPFDTTTPVIFYRTDTFKKLGLNPPQTLVDFDRALDVLDGAGYLSLFEFPGAAQWSLSMYTMPYGKTSIYVDSQGNPTVDWLDPDYQRGVLEMLNENWMHNSPGSNLNGGGVGVFGSDEIGTATPIYVTTTNNFASLHRTRPDIDGKWNMVTWPKAENGKSFNIMAGTAAVIFRDSKLKQAAFDWLLYLTSMPVQRQIVLDHLNRGENSDFFFSTVVQNYAPANDAFWDTTPDIQPDRALVEAFKKIIPSFDTQSGVQGSEEAGPLESNLLDNIGSYIQGRLQDDAGKHQMSRSEFVRAMGQGKFAQEHDQIKAEIKKKLADGYQEITPQALAILIKAKSEGADYANVVAHIDEARSAPDALKVAKWGAVLVLVAGTASIFRKKENRANWISYALVAPPVVLAIIFVFVPATVALYLSFTHYHPVLPLSAAQFKGLENYRDVFNSGELPKSLGHTFYYTIVTVPSGIMISLVFAYLLNAKLRAQRWWRFLYFAPMVTGVVSISLIFSLLFLDSKLGWINAALLRFHLVKDPILFLTSEKTFLPCVMALAIWQGLAFTILIFLAGLQQIPAEQYEAAEMDGANEIRRFWKIAVPGLRPQVFFVTVLGFIGGFQVFDQIYTLAGKSGGASARFGPNDAGETVVPLLYHYAFETFEMGKSAAVAYVLFAIILAITIVQLKLYGRGEV